MTAPSSDSNASLRWGIYLILVAIAVGTMTGKLLSINSVNRIDLERHLVNRDLKKVGTALKSQELSEAEYAEKLAAARERFERERQLQRPFLSANDRSRWLAIRALVELGTYEIDSLLDRDVWNTIDMVQHKGRDGKLHLYSSKPPLLITLLAGEYWIIHKLTGMTLDTHPYFVGRLMLFTINVVPLGFMFLIVAQMAEKFGKTGWGRIFVVAAACFGTMLTTFAMVLNNHTVAAVSTAIALASFVKIWCEGSTRVRDYAVCGFATAFTAANELPALSMFALAAAALLFQGNRRAWLLGFLPTAILVAIASFGTTYAAHGTLSPPYAHRSSFNLEDNWYQYKYTVEGVEVQSYWANRQGIDRGEESKLKYSWHCLLGHHGIFSLTPVWLLSFVGMFVWWRKGNTECQLALGIILITLVCLVFYLGLRPLEDRNYGGMTSGLRWMFWFAPLWLWAMLPVADQLGSRRWGQATCLVLLGLSALSASFPTWNPWTHPWIYQAMESFGYIAN